jgi:hypothetical protein
MPIMFIVAVVLASIFFIGFIVVIQLQEFLDKQVWAFQAEVIKMNKEFMKEEA